MDQIYLEVTSFRYTEYNFVLRVYNFKLIHDFYHGS